MQTFFDPQVWLSLLTLTAMEVVLSVDNLVVIALLVGRLPAAQQPLARRLGMTLALLPRLILLFALGWVLSLNRTDVLGLRT
jgi:predicted tellurium resistance membrane protein TerC